MPFDANGELVKGGLREQIDFIIKGGASGIVAGGSTGEGHTLTDAEFAAVMKEAYDATAGRVPFLAGLIVQSTRAAIERANMLKGMKVAALQVTPVHYLFKPDAQATIDHFRAIADATGIPILIYNVIPWNYLSVDLMLRIMDEVPGVVGMKQSGGDLKSISDLMLHCKPDNVVLAREDLRLHPTLLDFGIAKLSDASVAMTQTNMVFGTATTCPPSRRATPRRPRWRATCGPWG
jgi:4-hydroxy-tetrahydrodipicolinate synthase